MLPFQHLQMPSGSLSIEHQVQFHIEYRTRAVLDNILENLFPITFYTRDAIVSGWGYISVPDNSGHAGWQHAEHSREF
jgi:hypothetical protein